MITLILLDDHVGKAEKQEIANALSQCPHPLNCVPGKPGIPEFEIVAAKITVMKPSLITFVTTRSWLPFTLIDAYIMIHHFGRRIDTICSCVSSADRAIQIK